MPTEDESAFYTPASVLVASSFIHSRRLIHIGVARLRFRIILVVMLAACLQGETEAHAFLRCIALTLKSNGN